MAEEETGSNLHVTWLQGGTVLSLGVVAWALWRRRWRTARLGFRLGAACLEKWSEQRMHAGVMKLLARAETRAGAGDRSLQPGNERGTP